MYLNAYVPSLQTGGGLVYFLKTQLGVRVPSTVMVAPMSERFARRRARIGHVEAIAPRRLRDPTADARPCAVSRPSLILVADADNHTGAPSHHAVALGGCEAHEGRASAAAQANTTANDCDRCPSLRPTASDPLEPIGYVPPAAFEAEYYQRTAAVAVT